MNKNILEPFCNTIHGEVRVRPIELHSKFSLLKEKV